VLVFIAIAGLCFVLLNSIQYVVEQRQLRAFESNTLEIQRAGSLFAEGQFDDAFTSIRALTTKSPLEFRIRSAFDSLAHSLRDMADARFDAHDYPAAATLYTVLGRHEYPTSVETLRKIAMSQYHAGDYQRSLWAMMELHKQYPDNPELTYSIALMNLDKIQNINEAMTYFEKGKKLHQKHFEDAYGFSFENLVNPGSVAGFYFDVLQGSARCNILLSKFDDAVKDCDAAVLLRPEFGDTYRLRAMANARRRKMDTVCRDLARARRLGTTGLEALEKEFCL